MDDDVWVSSNGGGEMGIVIHSQGKVPPLRLITHPSAKVLCQLHGTCGDVGDGVDDVGVATLVVQLPKALLNGPC